jgi:glycerophosphoryl diester phosphodiesterase
LILLDRSARPIVAHRGGMGVAPENTLAAFARARRDGAEAFECDVRLTADGHVVVCHDATVDRTTEGTGAIGTLGLASLQQLNAAAQWKDASVGKQRVPLLSETLDAFPEMAAIIELKTTSVAIPALEVVRSVGAEGRVVFGAFEDAALIAPRAAGMATLASKSELIRLLPLALVGAVASRVPFAAISMSPTYYNVPMPLGGFARTTGVPVHVWTVNDPGAARRFWRAGAHGIVTDYPAVMVDTRKALS